jgi:hypothetical protein
MNASKIVPRKTYAIDTPQGLVRFIVDEVVTRRTKATGSPHDYQSEIVGRVHPEDCNPGFERGKAYRYDPKAILGPYEEQAELVSRQKAEKAATAYLLKDFVLQHGRDFAADADTLKGKRMKMQECFRNATLTVVERPWLIYCEGFVDADVILPIHHAWAVDHHGRVIDPTLRPKLLGGAIRKTPVYFGIPFKRSYLKRHLEQKGATFGLLDGMSKLGRDLLTGEIPTDEFLESMASGHRNTSAATPPSAASSRGARVTT